jgi:hypothetical protein
MNQYKYEEKSLLGGWEIEVRKGINHLGNIRKNPSSGKFQYYEGPNNTLNYSFEDHDLNVLKKRIEKLNF